LGILLFEVLFRRFCGPRSLVHRLLFCGCIKCKKTYLIKKFNKKGEIWMIGSE
jgi:hypothetical protein